MRSCSRVERDVEELRSCSRVERDVEELRSRSRVERDVAELESSESRVESRGEEKTELVVAGICSVVCDHAGTQ